MTWDLLYYLFFLSQPHSTLISLKGLVKVHMFPGLPRNNSSLLKYVNISFFSFVDFLFESFSIKVMCNRNRLVLTHGQHNLFTY